jgi:hypothetical protein
MVHDLSRVASHNEKNNGYYVVGLDVPKDLCVPLVIVSFILATISPLAFPADGTNNMVVGLQGEIHAAPVEDIVSIQANPSPLFQTILRIGIVRGSKSVPESGHDWLIPAPAAGSAGACPPQHSCLPG